MSRNYARFYILLNRLPTEDKDELKASLVSQYTGGRTESVSYTHLTLPTILRV